jgi:outer membrane protein assembly factor BamB
MQSNHNPAEPETSKPLRLWPGVVIAIILLLIRLGIPVIIPDGAVIAVLGGVICGLAIFIWWAFFSRAPRTERWGAIVLVILALFITSLLIHESISTGGQGMMFFIYAIPVMGIAFLIWAVLTHRLGDKTRRITMLLTILLVSGFWIILKTEGITGDFNPDLQWRWARSPEERLLLQEGDERIKQIHIQSDLAIKAEWPGFRGADRDGIVRGVQIETDWSAAPPEELWRRPIGPGCSSFAVGGPFLFTQEQRGEEEIVSCYHLNTGNPVWKHRDIARFWDSHAGAGPRSTPTLSNGYLYTLGATGILNALNAVDGSVVWSRDVTQDTDVKHSGWGFSSSPLVHDNLIIVAVVGQLIAYDIENGNPQWYGPDGGDSYSSPHLISVNGIHQILLQSGKGLISIAPDKGNVLWEYVWSGDSRIVQPAVITEHDLLVCRGDGMALRHISINRGTEAWTFQEHWTSSQLKPNFNDLVVHKGYAYGFNGPILTCIDIGNGERIWRGGRYGGQILLLADQDLMLILTEKGELAMVEASPDQFRELSKFEAIEGKTWNHPAMAGNILLVRNGEEMAAYRLSHSGE